MRTRNKALSLLIALTMALTVLAGCGGSDSPAAAGDATDTPATDAPAADSGNDAPAPAADGDATTLTFFTLNVDRTQGEGLVEQTLIDQYMAENPHISIQVEALENEAYKQKYKAYVASDSLADISYTWAYGAFITPLITGGYLAALDDSTYTDYTFSDAALGPYRGADGKLYGLPRSMDSYVMYYNKRIFEENNLSIPTTFEELQQTSETLRANGVMPCAVNGGEKWAITVMFQHIYFQLTQETDILYGIVEEQSSKFADHPDFLKVAQKCAELGQGGFFQDAFLTDDYAAMQNLFQQEQVAMMYMGNWLNSMHHDTNIPQEVRDNFGMFPLPPLEGSKGTARDNVCMVGGGYSLASNTPRLEESRKFLDWYMRPENWAKNAWEMSGIFSTQDMNAFITDDQKAGLQGDIIEYMASIDNMTGQVFQERGSPAYKTDAQDLVQELMGGMVSPEDFITRLDEATTRSYEAVQAGETAE